MSQDKKDEAVDHRAFKFRLDPTDAQLSLLAQSAGAARVGYNMLLGHNMAAYQARQELHASLLDSGHSEHDATRAVTDRKTHDPSLQTLSYQSFSTHYLTPEITRHRTASNAIKAGADPSKVWNDPRYETPWMHTIPRRVFISGLQHANTAYTNWFASMRGDRAGARVGRPRFKKKGRCRDSFTIPAPEAMGAKGAPYKRGEPRSGVIEDYRHVRLAFLGVLRTHNSTKRLVRACQRGGKIKSFTVSRNADRWYVSFLVASPARAAVTTKRQRANGAVGVDVGVHSLAALSNGEVFSNPRHGQLAQKKLKRAQRKLARTQKGSKGRARAAQRVGRLQHLVTLQRETTAHHLTKYLATHYCAVAIEDLNVSGMTRSAKGTMEHPGKNVKAKSGLNRSILDASFGRIHQQLRYKMGWSGADLQIIGRFVPSSKMCSECGTVKSKLPLSERVYECEHCGLKIDRDVNAAINILHAGAGSITPSNSPLTRGESKWAWRSNLPFTFGREDHEGRFTKRQGRPNLVPVTANE